MRKRNTIIIYPEGLSPHKNKYFPCISAEKRKTGYSLESNIILCVNTASGEPVNIRIVSQSPETEKIYKKLRQKLKTETTVQISLDSIRIDAFGFKGASYGIYGLTLSAPDFSIIEN